MSDDFKLKFDIPEADLRSDVQLLCNRIAMSVAKRARNELSASIEFGIKEFYNYKPHMYKRTYEFENDGFKDIYENQHGNKFVGGVMLSSSFLNISRARAINPYSYGGYVRKDEDGNTLSVSQGSHSVEEIYEWNLRGYHGKRTGISPWETLMGDYNKIADEIESWGEEAQLVAIRQGGYKILYKS